MANGNPRDRWSAQRLGRRRVLRAGATGVVGLGGATALACTTAPATVNAPPTTAPAPAATPATGAAPAATPAGPQPKYGGTYSHWTQGEAAHEDPHQTNNALLFTFGPGLAYSRLVTPTSGPERKGDDILIVGDVAERWDLADDRTYIFKLRPNIKFHNVKPVNGRALVAEDIKYSFDRQIGLRFNAGIFSGIEKMEAVDPQTFKVTLTKPDADFIATLSAFWNVIIAKEVVDQAPGGDLREGPSIGTGPWIPEKWEKNSTATLVKNPDYFIKGIPYVDRVEWIRINDDATRWSAFRTKQVFYGPVGFPKAQFEELKRQDPTLQIAQTRRNGGLIEIRFIANKKPFDDKRVRQAFRYALDIPQIIDTAFDGVGGLSTGVPMPEFGWFLPEDEMKQLLKRDVNRAKQLLAEAGFPNGLDVELINFRFNESYNTASDLAAAQLKDAGIRATLKPVELVPWTSEYTNAANKDFSVYLGATQPPPSTNAMLYAKYYKGNPFGLDDPQLNTMIDRQAAMVRDPAARKTALLELQRYLIDGSWNINLWMTAFTVGWWDFVKNMRIVNQPTSENEFARYVWLEK
jgi:ABC-type transport system substrate-binding protein